MGWLWDEMQRRLEEKRRHKEAQEAVRKFGERIGKMLVGIDDLARQALIDEIGDMAPGPLRDEAQRVADEGELDAVLSTLSMLIGWKEDDGRPDQR